MIPRGCRESSMTNESNGLLGKIVFQSDWTEERMKEEVRLVFAKRFGLSDEDISSGKTISYHSLQRTGAGAHTLCVPSVTQTFKWDGKQVSTLAKSGGIIYILSLDDIPVSKFQYSVSYE